MNFLILSVLLPVVYGCNGGSGGGSASLGSLFAGGSPSGSSTGSTSGSVGSGGGDALASIQNPEPATMMLIGGGVAAMAYLRSRVR